MKYANSITGDASDAHLPPDPALPWKLLTTETEKINHVQRQMLDAVMFIGPREMLYALSAAPELAS